MRAEEEAVLVAGAATMRQKRRSTGRYGMQYRRQRRSCCRGVYGEKIPTSGGMRINEIFKIDASASASAIASDIS